MPLIVMSSFFSFIYVRKMKIHDNKYYCFVDFLEGLMGLLVIGIFPSLIAKDLDSSKG
jgi:hypothetical protein